MQKKIILLIVLFVVVGLGSVAYYNKTYLKQDVLSSDIQNRIKINTKNSVVNNFTILQQKDMDNLRIVLYSYTANNLNLIECSVYEKTLNQRYKFVRGQQPGISTGNMLFSVGELQNNRPYFIHFGYIISDTYPNKYEITYGNETFVKEYNRNESFLELYDLKNGGVSIRPTYESKVPNSSQSFQEVH